MVTRLSAIRCRDVGGLPVTSNTVEYPLKTKVTMLPENPNVFLSTTYIVRDNGVGSPRNVRGGSPRRAGSRSPSPRRGEDHMVFSTPRRKGLDSFRIDKTRSFTLAEGVTLADLKQRLDGLATFCRGEKGSNWLKNVDRRRLESFLEQLYNLCIDLQVPLINHTSYRRNNKCGGALNFYFDTIFKNTKFGKTGSFAVDMEDQGFLIQSILISIFPVSLMNFQFNSHLVRACDCGDPNEKRKSSHSCNFPLSNMQKFDVSMVHFPPEISELKEEVEVHFLQLVQILPSKLQEFLGLQFPGSTQDFIKFKISMVSYLKVFDSYYSRFERAYMDFVSDILRHAYLPLVDLCSVVSYIGSVEDMEGLHISLLCRSLAAMKQGIDPSNRLIYYEPTLLEKALRVRCMNTFPAIVREANDLILKVNDLLTFMQSLQMRDGVSSHLHPDWSKNKSIRKLTTAVDESYKINRVIIRHAMINFFCIMTVGRDCDPNDQDQHNGSFNVGWLVRHLPEKFRVKLRKAVLDSSSSTTEKLDEEHNKALYETFPILILLFEIYGSAVRFNIEDFDWQKRRTSTRIESKSNMFDVKMNFLEIIADYHNAGPNPDKEEGLFRLKAEMQKYEERRFSFQTLFDYVLGLVDVHEQSTYFENLYIQLKSCAQINIKEDWLIVNIILQRIIVERDPNIFQERELRPISRETDRESTDF